jgi:DNA repair protein SbcD/Mre11
LRFLHTADWHVGKTLGGRSRLDEQEQVAAEIVDIAVRERVDCVLIAGDLFDSPAPTPDAQRIVCDALAEIAGAGMAAVIVAGNHDHRRLSALRKLAGRLKIFIRPGPGEADEGGLISYPKHGEQAKIAMLPWIPEYRIVGGREVARPPHEWKRAYAEHVAAACRRLAAGFAANTINLLVAHLYVDGAQSSGSERPGHVAQAFAIAPEHLPRAHYIALGHIHKPQEVRAASPCVYAGSPLQLDFGEQDQQKRVVIVEAHPETAAVWVSIPLAAGRRLREVVTTVDRLPEAARGAGSDFVRVVVKTQERIAGLSQRVSAALPNAVAVQQELPAAPAETRPTPVLLTPRERFRRFLREQKHVTATPAMLEAFDRLYEEAKDAADEA